MRKYLAIIALLALHACALASNSIGSPRENERCPEVEDDPFSKKTYDELLNEIRNSAIPSIFNRRIGNFDELNSWVDRGDVLTDCAFGVGYMHYLISQNAHSDVLFLLSRRVDPDRPLAYDGATPLMHALDQSAFSIAEALLSSGADAKKRTAGGMEALHYLALAHVKKHSDASRMQIQLAKRLIAQGSDVNAQDATGGATPVMFAVLKDNAALVRLFIDSGADLNLRNSAGNSPLMLAKKRGANNMARILIKAGAN